MGGKGEREGNDRFSDLVKKSIERDFIGLKELKEFGKNL